MSTSSTPDHGAAATAEPAQAASRREVGDLHRDRASRTLGGLSELLDARPDLLGVHAPADLAYDAVRWSA